MLPRNNRLPAPFIKAVLRRGRRLSFEGLQLFVLPNNLPVSRFAVVVPMSVDKRAVVRNRIRRVVRERLRRTIPTIAPGWDGVFIVRKI